MMGPASRRSCLDNACVVSVGLGHPSTLTGWCGSVLAPKHMQYTQGPPSVHHLCINPPASALSDCPVSAAAGSGLPAAASVAAASSQWHLLFFILSLPVCSCRCSLPFCLVCTFLLLYYMCPAAWLLLLLLCMALGVHLCSWKLSRLLTHT